MNDKELQEIKKEWSKIVDLCSQISVSSINVGNTERRDAILGINMYIKKLEMVCNMKEVDGTQRLPRYTAVVSAPKILQPRHA